MPLLLKNLDEETRRLMLEEIDYDIQRNALYISERLNEHGIKRYPDLLIQSVKSGNDADLASSLRGEGCFNPTVKRKNPKGGYTQVQMPSNAHETLAEGEYNRFYIRALCCRVINGGKGRLVVYRAKHVQTPRSESERKIGQIVDAEKLLQDLRDNPGVDTALGLPSGPNSGLSVELRD